MEIIHVCGAITLVNGIEASKGRSSICDITELHPSDGDTLYNINLGASRNALEHRIRMVPPILPPLRYGSSYASLNLSNLMTETIVSPERWWDCRTIEYSSDRYYGVNLMSLKKYNTVELRFMEGTTDIQRYEQMFALISKVYDGTRTPKGYTNPWQVIRSVVEELKELAESARDAVGTQCQHYKGHSVRSVQLIYDNIISEVNDAVFEYDAPIQLKLPMTYNYNPETNEGELKLCVD
jgi:hypothetical protein